MQRDYPSRRFGDLSLYGSFGPWGALTLCGGSTVGGLAGQSSRREDQAPRWTPSSARTRRSPPARPSILAATEGRTQLPCSPNGRAPVSRGWTLAGVTQTIVRGHSGQRGVPAGPACNKCHVRTFVKLSDVTDTVAAARIGFWASLITWVCGLYRSPPCRCDGRLASAPGTTKSPIWEC
jgi:hypothetical protein